MAPRRPSGGGSGAASKKAAITDKIPAVISPANLKQHPHMKLFEEWWRFSSIGMLDFRSCFMFSFHLIDGVNIVPESVIILRGTSMKDCSPDSYLDEKLQSKVGFLIVPPPVQDMSTSTVHRKMPLHSTSSSRITFHPFVVCSGPKFYINFWLGHATLTYIPPILGGSVLPWGSMLARHLSPIQGRLIFVHGCCRTKRSMGWGVVEMWLLDRDDGSCWCIVMYRDVWFIPPLKVTKDVQHALCQMIALRGLLTDTSVAGVEKIVVTEVQNQWLQKPRQVITSADIDVAGLLDPQTVFTVKGWNRSCCALLVVLAAYEMPEFLQAGVIC